MPTGIDIMRLRDTAAERMPESPGSCFPGRMKINGYGVGRIAYYSQRKLFDYSHLQLDDMGAINTGEEQ